MSGLEVVGLFLACADASVNILDAIKRRRGASQDIAELTTECEDKLRFIHTLMNKVEAPPHSSSLLDMILQRRLKEFKRVELKLEAILPRSTRDSRVKRFWKAQDTAKALGSIDADLDKLQLALEVVVVQWEQRNVVQPSTEEGVIHNAATDQELCNSMQVMTLNPQESTFLPNLQLSSGDFKLLYKYGGLDKVPLGECLYNAWESLRDESSKWAQRKRMQFLQKSAKLQYRPANTWLGYSYRNGDGVEQNYELAIEHFRAGEWNPHAYVATAYLFLGNHKKARKHLRLAESDGVFRFTLTYSLLQCLFGSKYVSKSKEEADRYASCVRDDSFISSVCFFLGIGSPKSPKKALRSYKKCEISEMIPGVVQLYDNNDHKVMGNAREVLYSPPNTESDYGSASVFYHLVADSGESVNTKALASYFEFLVEAGHVREIQSLAAVQMKAGNTSSAKQWIQRGADHGLIECQVWLAAYYRSTKRNCRAEGYLRSAMKGGNSSKHYTKSRFNSSKEHAKRAYMECYESKRAVARAVKDTPEADKEEVRKQSRKQKKRK